MDANLDISVACDLAAIADAQTALRRFAAAHGLSDRIAFAMEMAADEMLSNAIRHGFTDGHTDRRIRCQAEIVDDRTVMRIQDNGAPFDPLLDAPAPDLESGAAEAPIGGLGVHIVKSLADCCRYKRDGEFNILTLSWKS